MTGNLAFGLAIVAIMGSFSLGSSMRDDRAPMRDDGGMYVMPWMCLEICDSQEEIQTQLGVLGQRNDILSGVSYEKYSLGPQCHLVTNDSLTVISKDDLHGLDDWPMISSYPHPPEFITWFRSVIYIPACTEKFIASALEEAKKYSYTGFNLDWEPVFSEGAGHQEPLTQKDADQYAKFIDTFAAALHESGFKLGVDVANWSSGEGAPPIWDFDAIAKTQVDKVISMSTYTSNDDLYASNVNALVDAFGTERSGVGLMTVNATDETSPLSTEEIQYRFDLIAQAGVKEVDIWRMPIPENFWNVIQTAVKK